MNNYGKGAKKKKNRRNKKTSYLNGLNVPISNSNQNVLIYSRQNSNNNLDTPQQIANQQSKNRNSINICNNIAQNKQQKNVNSVIVEVHSPQSEQENQIEQNSSVTNLNENAKNLTYTKNNHHQITKEEISQLNGCTRIIEENNDKNSQSNKAKQQNGHLETELDDKNTKRLRRYSEIDEELNLPLINQKPYHKYDQVPIIFDQSHTSSNGLIKSYNQSIMNGFNGKLDASEDAISLNDELNNKRRSLV